MRFLLSIKAFLLGLFRTEQLIRNKYVEIIPEELRPGFLYVEGDGYKNQFASLLCPCGCNEDINLNLEPDEDPCWSLSAGNLTDLSPSIWKSNNCRSHFFIKKGKVKWCPDNNQ
ncbi:DUF6527 family protein [Pedobacter vanadiisoli]|uniref:DUF6527 family protein n=1 Tax=Pedobacter vanadiisoli TaxID=1761975 RepID=A0ABW5MIM2_9SPHI